MVVVWACDSRVATQVKVGPSGCPGGLAARWEERSQASCWKGSVAIKQEGLGALVQELLFK
jgi:hypothetical protein